MKKPRRITSRDRFILESAAYIRKRTSLRPRLAVVLGSGLGDVVDRLREKVIIPTSTIPHYPQSTVEGHRGNIVFGTIKGATVLLFQGRIHYYESGDREQSLYPIHVAHALGIQTLLVTNAAGGIDTKFGAGDFMVLTDQINLSFETPLMNILEPPGNHQLYDQEIIKLILATGHDIGIRLQKGVYCGVKGPSYETAAEIEMIRRIGGDAVGMSTVNEVSFASALGMNVAGISCITNLATGITKQKLSHEEVTVVARRVKSDFIKLLTETIARLHTFPAA